MIKTLLLLRVTGFRNGCNSLLKKIYNEILMIWNMTILKKL